MRDWSLIELLEEITRRWLSGVLLVLLGGIIGWGSSFVLPQGTIASADLYVGIDAYRAYKDRYVASVAQKSAITQMDDYKNWQMNQLETLAFSKGFLEETQDELVAQDEYWRAIDEAGLREMLHLEWRNAGVVHLYATHMDATRAEQAVWAWRNVIDGRVDEAVEYAIQVMFIDGRLSALQEEKVDAETRLSLINVLLPQIDEIVADLEQRDAKETLSVLERWEIEALVMNAMGWNGGWEMLMAKQPADDLSPRAYTFWLEQVKALLEAEKKTLPPVIGQLAEEIETLEEGYQQAGEKSLGLSANLKVDPVTEEGVSVQRIHHTGVFILVGCVLGLLFWLGKIIVSLAQQEM